MSPNTGPAQIAEIVNDETRFRTWVAFTLQEIKTDLSQHIVEDKIRFDNLNERLGGVSSSVTGFEALKNKGLGMKQVIIGALVFIGGLGGFIVAAIQVAKALKGAP